jgi:hypothetical protein
MNIGLLGERYRFREVKGATGVRPGKGQTLPLTEVLHGAGVSLCCIRCQIADSTR